MTVQTVQSYLLCLSFALTQIVWIAEGDSIFIHPGKSTQAVVPPYGTLSFTVQNISSSFSFVLFQAHIQHENVSISSSEMFESDITVEGSHVGILNLLKQTDDQSTLYLKSDVNISVNVVLHAQLHSPSDPVPGGCNQIFKLEIDPNIHINTHTHWTFVDFQWANVGFPRQGIQKSCDIQKYQGRLQYDIFVHFLSDQSEETFLSGVSKMLSVDDIEQNGRKVMTISNTGTVKSVGSISAIQGQGVVYAVVVTDTSQNTKSSYVSVETYTCQLGDADCDRIYTTLAIFIAVFSGICGLFLCFQGHRYLKTEFFVFGFIGFMLICYIVLTKESELSVEASFGVSVVGGLIGGVLFLLFWYYCGVPVGSVLLVGLTAGYLVSSLLFYTPFGNISYWDSTMTYGLTFTCGLLIAPVFLLCFTRTLNILSCTFVGSYLCAICVDIFLQSNLKYIVLYTIYKQTLPNYLSIKGILPFGKNEIILSVFWGALFFVGSAFQFFRERKKAPFPPCPAHMKKARRMERPLSRPGDDERRPLLDESSRPQYTRGEGRPRTDKKRQASAPPIEHNEPT